MLSWVRLLTVSMLRLNSRDYIRNWSTTDDHPENATKLSSIRIEPSRDAYGSKAGVSATVHWSTAMDFGRNKSDPDEEPAFDVTKPVRYLHLLATDIDSTYFIAGCNYYRLSNPRLNIGVEHVGS